MSDDLNDDDDVTYGRWGWVDGGVVSEFVAGKLAQGRRRLLGVRLLAPVVFAVVFRITLGAPFTGDVIAAFARDVIAGLAGGVLSRGGGLGLGDTRGRRSSADHLSIKYKAVRIKNNKEGLI